MCQDFTKVDWCRVKVCHLITDFANKHCTVIKCASFLLTPSGFGGRGVLPGVATGTDLNQKSSKGLKTGLSVAFTL